MRPSWLLSGEPRIRCLLDFGKRQRIPRTKAIIRRLPPGLALRHVRHEVARYERTTGLEIDGCELSE